MRQRLVVGNWKMNGDRASNAALLEALLPGLRDSECKAVVCPPFPYLQVVGEALSGGEVGLGAQDVSAHRQGAFTGEVAAEMLRDVGCSYVIVGHSERRQYHRESSELVAQKASLVLEHGMTPIICVGETLAEREASRTEEIVSAQLAAAIARIGPEMGRTVVAYEPVWAIGTGRTATPEQAQAVHAMLRERLTEVSEAAGAIPLLYGGSVKADNAANLFGCADIDGALVGGAALNAREFLAICLA
ncbi:MAG: triose-phosphate isomerase [Casimicrobiaceae bacterium]